MNKIQHKIAVISGKGGVGKTTVVTNLSTALATKFNKGTTVIDCNVTASHLSMHFGAYLHPHTLNHVLKNESSIEEAIFVHNTGVKIIPASLNLSDLIGIDISVLDEKLNNLFENDDFVFLDTAPGFGKEAVSATKACKEALIVTTPNIPALTDVIRSRKVLEERLKHLPQRSKSPYVGFPDAFYNKYIPKSMLGHMRVL